MYHGRTTRPVEDPPLISPAHAGCRGLPQEVAVDREPVCSVLARDSEHQRSKR